jgi:DNA-binding NarL/FixJ family response regulator
VVKFLLVDDHPLMRAALRSVVESLGDEVQAIEAGTPGEARDALGAHADIEVVLLDLKLGDTDGFGVLRDIRSTRPHVPVMVLTASDDGRDLIRAIDGGAVAYVHKRSPRDEILAALETVLSGGIHLPEDTLALLQASRQAASAEAAAVASASALLGSGPVGGMGFAPAQPSPQVIERLGLTPRQTDVLLLLLHGKPNKLIARELNLSVETIKDHVAAVLRSLNVTSRTQAVLAVTQLGSHGVSGARRGLQ